MTNRQNQEECLRISIFLVFIVVLCIGIFALQNSSAPPIQVKFLFWQLDTSMVYALLSTLGAGILVILILLIPSALKNSFRIRTLKCENDILKREVKNLKLSSVSIERQKDEKKDR